MKRKITKAKIRINATERELLDALERVSNRHTELTTEEIGAAMRRILSNLNSNEINEYCEENNTDEKKNQNKKRRQAGNL